MPDAQASFTDCTCSKIFAASTTSIFLPVTSTMRPRTMRKHEIEHDGDDHADRKRNQRRNRAVRHDAIVDVHREDRRGEREQIDDQRGNRDVAVVLPEPLGDGPEPVLLHRRAVAMPLSDCAAGRTKNA